MSKKIKTISFLVGEQRVFIEATKYGRFKVPVIKTTNGYSRTVDKALTPTEMLKDPRIRKSDPTLTLENGEKIRVFQGGDPTYMLALAMAAIDFHEKLSREQNNARLTKPKPRKKVIVPDYDIFQDIMNWDDADTD